MVAKHDFCAANNFSFLLRRCRMRRWYFIKSTRPFIRGSHQIHLAICKVIRVAQRTDDWGVSLDRREAVAVVAVDQSKAFDSVCLPLLLAKLKAYSFTDDALELMTAYRLGRRCWCSSSSSLVESDKWQCTTGVLVWSFVIQFLRERSQLLCV